MLAEDISCGWTELANVQICTFWTDKLTDNQTDKQTVKQTDKKTDKQTDKKSDKQQLKKNYFQFCQYDIAVTQYSKQWEQDN